MIRNDKGIKLHLNAETMNHFSTCSSYVNEACAYWATINGHYSEIITRVRLAVEKIPHTGDTKSLDRCG